MARSAHHPGVHHQDHPGTARSKSHARPQPLTRRSSPSRRGCRTACLCRRPRAQQGRISGVFLVWAAVRAHHTATFACPSACQAWRWPTSTTCGESWWLGRPGSTPSWRRYRRSSGNLLNLQSLPRLRVPVAREELPLRGTPLATPTLPRLQNQVTFSKFV